jgi:hypothetical protein
MLKFKPLSDNLEQKLFCTQSCIVEYSVINEDLHQLYNFCLNFQSSTLDKINSLKEEKTNLESDLFKIQCEYDGLEFRSIDFIHGLEEFEIPTWDNSYNFIVPLNQLLLISIFLEKSLKSLCSEYSPENNSDFYGGYKIVLQSKRKSKIETYINYLKTVCNLEIKLSQEILLFLDQTRNVRNAFVHGDWDEIGQMFIDFNSNESFIIVSKLLEEIEKAYMKNVA